MLWGKITGYSSHKSKLGGPSHMLSMPQRQMEVEWQSRSGGLLGDKIPCSLQSFILGSLLVCYFILLVTSPYYKRGFLEELWDHCTPAPLPPSLGWDPTQSLAPRVLKSPERSDEERGHHGPLPKPSASSALEPLLPITLKGCCCCGLFIQNTGWHNPGI